MSLPLLLATARREPGRLAASIPPNWMQGRTAYGGLSTALAYEAARTADEALPPLRAAQVAFIGPVASEAQVSAFVERRGRNASWVRTEIRSDGALVHAATFVFMGAVESEVSLDLLGPPEDIPAPEDAVLVPETPGPEFLSNFETRRATPLHGDGDVCCWLRLKDGAEGVDPVTHLLAIADGLPPGARTLMTHQAPVSSMTWQMGMLSPEPATRDGWWLLRSSADYARAGCSTQAMHVWNRNGVPMVSGAQTIALFG